MSDRILPLQPDSDPLAYAARQELSVDMQVCRHFIIRHGLGGIYAPDTLTVPDTFDPAVLPTAPAEAPTKSTPGYLRLVRAIGNRLTAEEREAIRGASKPYRIKRKPGDTTIFTVPEQIRQGLPMELARRMLLVERELNSEIKQFENL